MSDDQVWDHMTTRTGGDAARFLGPNPGRKGLTAAETAQYRVVTVSPAD